MLLWTLKVIKVKQQQHVYINSRKTSQVFKIHFCTNNNPETQRPDTLLIKLTCSPHVHHTERLKHARFICFNGTFVFFFLMLASTFRPFIHNLKKYKLRLLSLSCFCVYKVDMYIYKNILVLYSSSILHLYSVMFNNSLLIIIVIWQHVYNVIPVKTVELNWI